MPFKQKLQEELKRLEGELASVGRKNPSNPKDWEATPGEMDIETSDKSDVAEAIEAYEDRSAILKDLEIQYSDVKDALARIENDTFGKCSVGGEDISLGRLEALPTAKTCMAHHL